MLKLVSSRTDGDVESYVGRCDPEQMSPLHAKHVANAILNEERILSWPAVIVHRRRRGSGQHIVDRRVIAIHPCSDEMPWATIVTGTHFTENCMKASNIKFLTFGEIAEAITKDIDQAERPMLVMHYCCDKNPLEFEIYWVGLCDWLHPEGIKRSNERGDDEGVAWGIGVSWVQNSVTDEFCAWLSFNQHRLAGDNQGEGCPNG